MLWSVQLLPEPHRLLFAALATCAGGFDLAAATALGGLAGLDPAAAADALGALVHASLVRPLETAAGRRFAMLNTVRGVAAELLADRRPAAVEALAGLWLARAAAVDVLRQPAAAELAQAEADLPTTRLVLAALLGAGRCADAAGIVLANRRRFAALGRQDETLRAATGVLAAAGEAGLPAAVRARVAVVAGGAAYVCGDPDTDRLLAALAELPAADATYRVLAHTSTCALLADRLDHAGALDHARAALDVAEQAGTAALARLSHSAAAWAALRRDDYDAAAEHGRRQLEYVTDDGEAVLSLVDVAAAGLCRGDLDGAEEAAHAALLAARRLGPSQFLAEAQRALGYVLLHRDAAPQAAALLAAALGQWATTSDSMWPLEVAAGIGLAAEVTGPPGPGAALVRRATAFARREGETETAVPKELLAVARRLPDLGLDAGRLPPLGRPEDLVADAIRLAGSVTWLAAG